MQLPRTAWAVAALALLGPAACSGGDDDVETARPSTTTTTIPAMPTDFDWWHPVLVDLGGGWELGPCTGEGTELCFEHPEQGRRGILELFRFRAPEDANLNNHAARFVEDFVADRTRGCGAEYRVEAEPLQALALPDGSALRYGFHGGSSGAPDTERTVQWAGVREGVLVIVTLNAYDPGSCVTGEGEGSLDDQTEVLERVHALVLASGLPDPGGP